MTSTSPINGTAVPGAADIRDTIKGVQDSLNVRRVFGEPQQIGNTTVIGVARVAGGAGGGAGDGQDDSDGAKKGQGFGSGFGLSVRPLGAYQVTDGDLVWKPAVDVDRLMRGFQVLAGIIAVCVTLVQLRRSSD